MGALESRSVQRVAAALAANGARHQVIELSDTARTAADAAAALGVPVGAIAKSLVFLVGEAPVMALVAGDRRCRTQALPEILGLAGKAARADADVVRAATGFAIGGVAPVGHTTPLRVVVDTSLGRFREIYAAAGHPHCVFSTTFVELLALTGGIASDRIAEP